MINSESFLWTESLRGRLKEARDYKGISQPKAAEIIGVEGNTLWRWENGYVKKIPIEGLLGLSRLYDVSLGWLIGQEEALSPEESELLRMFHRVTPDFRRSILAALHAWLDEQPDYEQQSGEEANRPLELARL